MKILVIGGTAFMGPFLVRRLAARGHDVTVFHRGNTPVPSDFPAREITGDRKQLAASAPALQAVKPDVVVDMVLVTEAQAREAVQTFRGHAGRYVAVSSIDVYRAYGIINRSEDGPLAPTPVTEDSELRRVHFPYKGKIPGMDEYDKILVERAALAEPSLPGTVLRLPMVYGPGDRQHRLFELLRRMDDKRSALLVDAAMAGWRGARGYVENVAAAIALAAEDPRAKGRTYNVAEEESPPMVEWMRRVGEAAGWRGEIVAVPGKMLPEGMAETGVAEQDLTADSSRIRRELGYREEIGQAEALKRTVAWERAHPPGKPEPVDYAAEDRALAAWKEAGRGQGRA